MASIIFEMNESNRLNGLNVYHKMLPRAIKIKNYRHLNWSCLYYSFALRLLSRPSQMDSETPRTVTGGLGDPGGPSEAKLAE